jgi:general secretion pathway protein G
MKRNARGRRREGGFTLIEVLLVLVILVVLASTVIIAYGPIQHSANVKAATLHINALKTAIQAYSLDMGTYPPSLEDLMAVADSTNPRHHGPYLTDIPLDPWSQQYQYTPQGTRSLDGFDVWTTDPTTGLEIGNWKSQ